MRVYATLYLYEHQYWYSGGEGADTVPVFIVLVLLYPHPTRVLGCVVGGEQATPCPWECLVVIYN